MTKLKDQPSKMPTRKIVAVIVAGAVTGGVQSALDIFWPDNPFAPIMDDFNIWVQAAVMIIAGYMTRDKDV